MSHQQPNHSGFVKKTKKPIPLLPRKAKVKKKKPRIRKSRSRDKTEFSPSLIFRSPTPSLHWRSKPSINCCDSELIENPSTACSSNMYDSPVITEISAKRYDRLRATLHSTVLPIVIPKGSTVVKNTHKSRVLSKSTTAKPAQEIPCTSCGKTSVQSTVKPIRAKSRYWIPTPKEMAIIGDKIPRVFVHTSHTGRKSVAVPTDTPTWLCGNLTPIKSTRSAAENQTNLVRGGRPLDKKLRRKFKNIIPSQLPLIPSPQPTPSHVPAVTAKKVRMTRKKTAPKQSKDDPLAKKTIKKIHASKHNPSKPLKKNPPGVAAKKSTKPVQIKPPAEPKKKNAKALRNDVPAETKKKNAKASRNDVPSIISAQVQPTERTNRRKTQPNQLNSIRTLYTNEASKLCRHKDKDLSFRSLPSPITPVQLLKAETDTKEIMPTSKSLGLNPFVKCFYCHKRFPLDVLREHQEECAKETLIKRHFEAFTPQDFVSTHFENSFYKLNFEGSSCSFPTYDDRPTCVEEGGKLLALPANVASNETISKRCWYCGREYNLGMANRHIAECSAAQSFVTPTAEGKKRMKNFGRRHPKKKKDLLWCKDA